MPTVTYKKSELRKLIGKKISDEQIAETITLIKPNLEKVEGEEITIEHTADRPDLFSAEGMSRAIASYLGLRKGLEKFKVAKPKVEVDMSSVSVRPYVSAAVVRNVKMDAEFFESMIKIQELLSDSIGRKRSKVAIGIHDLDKIDGKISYSGASKSEMMVPLEHSENMTLAEVLEKTEKGREYGDIIKSSRSLPVFTDSAGIFSLPPILNSDRTKITEKTKNLFVEVTGVDKRAVGQVMSILVTNFAERKFSIEGVKLKHGKKSEVTPDLSGSVMEVDLKIVNGMLGLRLTSSEAIGLLSRMGYDAFASGEKIEVMVPAYRTDILHPVDIVEDVAIAYGYNDFKPEMPRMSTDGKLLDIEKTCNRASTTLVGFGFQEILSSSLSNPKDQFEKMRTPRTQVIEIENPSSSEHTCLRVSIVPGLMKFLAANKHYEYPQNIFEIGDVVLEDKEEETLARNERRMAGAICHSRAGFAEMSSIVDGLMKSLGVGHTLDENNSEIFIPGRGVDVYVGKKFVGSFGELHPAVIQDWDIGMPIAVFEISLEGIA